MKACQGCSPLLFEGLKPPACLLHAHLFSHTAAENLGAMYCTGESADCGIFYTVAADPAQQG